MKVSVLGYGTVGRGVCDMIRKNNALELGCVLVLPQEVSEPFHVTDIKDIVNDSGVDTVVECMGGIGAAYNFVLSSIRNRKNVVTSNKALVAAKGLELAREAAEHNVQFLFSAACGGAIPVLHNIGVAAKTDRIISAGGILNGTTNYILSSMQDGKMTYRQALENAKKLGYAEADPSADVSGMDTCRKIMLICSSAFDMLPVKGVCVRGIEQFTKQDADYFAGLSLVCRLVGRCGIKDGKLYAYVEPSLFPLASPFACVSSNYNLAFYEGENSGEIFLGGQGAGRYPTASAVLRDISSIGDGISMMGKNCSEAEAVNSIEHDYIVRLDGKYETLHCTVQEMHDRKCDFFASVSK